MACAAAPNCSPPESLSLPTDSRHRNVWQPAVSHDELLSCASRQCTRRLLASWTWFPKLPDLPRGVTSTFVVSALRSVRLLVRRSGAARLRPADLVGVAAALG